MSTPLLRFGKFSATISLNKLSTTFSLFPPSGISMIRRLLQLVVPSISHRLSSFFFIPLSFCCFDWIISNDLNLSSLIHSSSLSSLMLRLLNSSVHSLYSSAPDFPFDSSKCFSFFLLKFSFYSCIVFLFYKFYNSLSIFRIVILFFFVIQFLYLHLFRKVTKVYCTSLVQSCFFNSSWWCLCIWRSSHLLQTLGTDFGKKRPSQVVESILECAVTLGLLIPRVGGMVVPSPERHGVLSPHSGHWSPQ